MVRRNVPFEAGVSIGVIQAGANENSILSDCAICDYSDRLLGQDLGKMRAKSQQLDAQRIFGKQKFTDIATKLQRRSRISSPKTASNSQELLTALAAYRLPVKPRQFVQDPGNRLSG